MIVPVAGCLLTGMPPFYPPLFLTMSVELAVSSAVVSLVFSRTSPRIWPALLSGTPVDRLASIILTYNLAGLVRPATRVSLTLAHFAQGLPGDRPVQITGSSARASGNPGAGKGCCFLSWKAI